MWECVPLTPCPLSAVAAAAAHAWPEVGLVSTPNTKPQTTFIHMPYPFPLLQAAERRKALFKYVREVQPALVEQFVADGPQAVVAAMKNTITNMLGTLPPQFFTVTISTVGENMSQLMLSVMMTGYLFRNAQYRLELRNALGGGAAAGRPNNSSSATTAAQYRHGSSHHHSSDLQRAQSAPQQGSVLDEEAYAPGVQKSRVQVCVVCVCGVCGSFHIHVVNSSSSSHMPFCMPGQRVQQGCTAAHIQQRTNFRTARAVL